jgi:hypothetical protein
MENFTIATRANSRAILRVPLSDHFFLRLTKAHAETAAVLVDETATPRTIRPRRIADAASRWCRHRESMAHREAAASLRLIIPILVSRLNGD